MSQRSIRFPDELERRIVEKAAADDRSFSYVVLRALESALGGAEDTRVATPSGRSAPASIRTSEDLDEYRRGETMTPSRADRFRNARKP